MKLFKLALIGFAATLSSVALAQMVKSKAVATNGVEVVVYSDDFAGRYEYTAPSIDFSTGGGGRGVALVAKVRKNGTLNKTSIQGFIIYTGSWQYFTSAAFRGGDPVNYTRTGGDVGSCRYGCTLTEHFSIELSPQDIAKHSENGIVAVQVRASKTANTGIMNIPVRYIDAINEVAK